jgi:hypothetical protein
MEEHVAQQPANALVALGILEFIVKIVSIKLNTKVLSEVNY